MIGKIIRSINNKILYSKIRKVACFNKTYLFKETEIQNYTKSKNNILIGEQSCIRGKLIVCPNGKIEIGANVYIGEDTRICSMESVKIEDDVLIAHCINIYDNNNHSLDYNIRKHELSHILEKGHPSENIFNVQIKPITIKKGAWICMNSTILKGVTIGEGAIVGANSLVTKDVEPYTMVAGNPAKFIKMLR